MYTRTQNHSVYVIRDRLQLVAPSDIGLFFKCPAVWNGWFAMEFGGGWPDPDMLLLRSPLVGGSGARWPLIRWLGMLGCKKIMRDILNFRCFLPVEWTSGASDVTVAAGCTPYLRKPAFLRSRTRKGFCFRKDRNDRQRKTWNKKFSELTPENPLSYWWGTLVNHTTTKAI